MKFASRFMLQISFWIAILNPFSIFFSLGLLICKRVWILKVKIAIYFMKINHVHWHSLNFQGHIFENDFKKQNLERHLWCHTKVNKSGCQLCFLKIITEFSSHILTELCFFLFVCLFVFCHICDMWEFPGQGSNLCHSSNLSHCSDSARSLTGCTMRELYNSDFLNKTRAI